MDIYRTHEPVPCTDKRIESDGQTSFLCCLFDCRVDLITKAIYSNAIVRRTRCIQLSLLIFLLALSRLTDMASSTTQPTDGTCTAHGTDCKPASSTFDKASEGADSIQYEDEYEKSNAALQLTWNTRMNEGNYKSPSFYKKVKCLLVSWDKECDDLDTEEEVSSSNHYQRHL